MNPEEVELKVRHWLMKEKVRLCDPPYTVNGARNAKSMKDLGEKIATDLNFSSSFDDALEILRVRALENVKANEHFATTQEATLKIKLPSSLKTADSHCSGLILHINLNENGIELLHRLSSTLGVPVDSLKVICQGRVIKNNASLSEQGLKNNSQAMLLYSKRNEEETQKFQKDVEDKNMDVEKIRKMVDYLCDRAIDDKFYHDDFQMDILNQNGEPVPLSSRDKCSLVRALSLHNLAKTLISKRNFEDALIFLLISDEAFSACNDFQSLNTTVDNYSALQLEIVWCYLMLERILELGDAERRLKIAWNGLQTTYQGKQLHKKDEARYQLLELRFHILSSFCSFYQNRDVEAKQKYSQAMELFRKCQVDENSFVQVLSIGINEEEAKYALFVCRNNISEAVDFVYQERNTKRQMKTKHEDEEKEKYFEKTLGKTRRGNNISVPLLDELKSMGYHPQMCLQALRETDNNIVAAIDRIMNEPDGLQTRIDSLHLSRPDIDINGKTFYLPKAKRRGLASKLSKEKKIAYYSAYNILKLNDWNWENALLQVATDSLYQSNSTTSESHSASRKDSGREIEELIYEHFNVGDSSYSGTTLEELDLHDERNALQRLSLLLQIDQMDIF